MGDFTGGRTIMKKILCFILCLLSVSVSAQMLDLIGSGAIGGAMTKGSVNSVNQGINMLKYTQLVRSLTYSVNVIRINHMGNYARVSNSDIDKSSFYPYGAQAGSLGRDHFYIELTGLSDTICKRFVSGDITFNEIYINGHKGGSDLCSSSSKIKFIFN
jgi:hypothetical protein